MSRTPEANLWRIEERSEGENAWHGQGFIAVYVDDVMASGSESTAQGFLNEFRRRFESQKERASASADWR